MNLYTYLGLAFTHNFVTQRHLYFSIKTLCFKFNPDTGKSCGSFTSLSHLDKTLRMPKDVKPSKAYIASLLNECGMGLTLQKITRYSKYVQPWRQWDPRRWNTMHILVPKLFARILGGWFFGPWPWHSTAYSVSWPLKVQRPSCRFGFLRVTA